MDMASLLSMFSGGQGQQAANPGAMQPPGGPGFGLGQPLMQGGQMAQPTSQPGFLQQMLGAGQAAMGGQGQQGSDPAMMQKLMMVQQMMQAQQGQQQPQGGMGAAMMPMMGGMQQAQQGQRGQYLAQGGGMARRFGR